MKQAELIINRAVDFHEQNVGSQYRFRERLMKKRVKGGSARKRYDRNGRLQTASRRLKVAIRDPRRGIRGVRREADKLVRHVIGDR